MLQSITSRARTSLAGRWRFVPDPYEAGYRGPHGGVWDLGWFRGFPLRPGIGEVDFDRAELLHVPGDWNSQDDRWLYYEGTAWYKTDVPAVGGEGTRVFLHFGAANYDAAVWLDGEPLGTHEGGFTPFAFEVTGRLRPQGSRLVVKVDNTRREEAVPTKSTDWWNYGGLTRDVQLVEVPETFIRRWFLHLDGDTIRGFVELDGTRPEQHVALRIGSDGPTWEGRTGADGRAEVALPAANLARWSPQAPIRHAVTWTAETDTLSEPMGFRTVETRGSEILLNGEPVFLRGISIHEEAPGRPGRASGEDDARTLLGWARDLGCNFVRLAHYPHDESMSRVAEEMGFLVWAEIPVYWGIAWEREDTLANARNQLTELIERDRNRASVILWSLANETPRGDARLAFLTDLAETARALDPSRLLTAALFAHGEGERQFALEDELGEVIDVMGCNQYLGWYYHSPADVPEWRWSSRYERPLIMSEFGGGALQGHHGDRETFFTEENQAWVYEAQIAMLREIPFLAGLSPWILKDFRSPRRVLADIQDGWNRKGLVSDRGVRKQAFEVLRRFYAERAEKERARRGPGA